MCNQIQLRERASYSYCARSWRQLRLEQLLRIFRALQTSRVLHISKNARWRMKQLLIIGPSDRWEPELRDKCSW